MCAFTTDSSRAQVQSIYIIVGISLLRQPSIEMPTSYIEVQQLDTSDISEIEQAIRTALTK